jgi:hypothetical protein
MQESNGFCTGVAGWWKRQKPLGLMALPRVGFLDGVNWAASPQTAAADPCEQPCPRGHPSAVSEQPLHWSGRSRPERQLALLENASACPARKTESMPAGGYSTGSTRFERERTVAAAEKSQSRRSKACRGDEKQHGPVAAATRTTPVQARQAIDRAGKGSAETSGAEPHVEATRRRADKPRILERLTPENISSSGPDGDRAARFATDIWHGTNWHGRHCSSSEPSTAPS